MKFHKIAWWQREAGCLLLAVLTLALTSGIGNAKDTDIYKVNAKQNCYILMDNSGSMSFGVYEHNIDYGAMFDYLFTLKDNGSYHDYIYDTINYSDYFYQNHEPQKKIYLWMGAIGVTVAHVNGKDVAFTGDAADPNYLWYSDKLVDTHTLIDADGNLADDGSGQQRLTVNSNGHVLFDGQVLPLNMDIKLHDTQTLYDGSKVDNGFGGLLNAPGYYFSGYEGVNKGSLNVAESGDSNIYFFVTGNWVNMQAMYNLHYTTNPPGAAGNGDPAWKYELFPISSGSWSPVAYSLKYPDAAKGDSTGSCSTGSMTTPCYENNLAESSTTKTITHLGAKQIQVHFSRVDLETNYDYVALYDGSNNFVAKYDKGHVPADGWSATVNGDTVYLKVYSDSSIHYSGYEVDKYRVTYNADSYLMQDRLDVAKDAMTYVVNEFRGRMNWGFASFKYNGTSADGANIRVPLNPSENDDTHRQAIIQQIANVTPKYGTPLGEALQDMFEKGYYKKQNVLNNLLCRKNYVIVMTDGFPSGDNDWSRISNVAAFTDADGDGWTEDPYQYSNPPPDYYDDVAHWMYTHSWIDKSLVKDPANSYVNVITDHISFGAKHPLLEDAASVSGGKYITAYNKVQLVNAFYSLALQMVQAVSFTAPVVSVDAANKIQSGDDLYMGLFLPADGDYWVGNLKKFRLGDGSAARPNPWMIYDGANNEAVDSSGTFLDNTAAIWDDDNDPNDSDNHGSADVKEDGAGSVLLKRVVADFNSGNYWERPIYTYIGGLKVKFDRNNVTPADLGVTTSAERDKIVNFVYGYTNDADSSGNPTAVRDWALGPIVHSRPIVVDYYDSGNLSHLVDRYVVVGANDGMLHVFYDKHIDYDANNNATTVNEHGREVFAFIPTEILGRLAKVITDKGNLVDTVDGLITLFRRNNAAKYLIFGERRGGTKYWNLNVTDSDPVNWSVQWSYSNSELGQSWSQPDTAKIPVAVDASTGKITFQDVLVFTGGYDALEDNYPEPFDDVDNNGTPFKSNGIIDSAEWSVSNTAQDINGNKHYDIYNPGKDTTGRGLFVVDMDDPATSVSGALPFSVTYGTSDVTSGLAQTLAGMKFCFPADPSIIYGSYNYSYTDTSNVVRTEHINRNLQVVYFTDIYGNIYRLQWNFAVQNNGTKKVPNWQVSEHAWVVKKIFSANPGSLSGSGNMRIGADTSDSGRKTFYPPAVSFGGAGNYFDSHNYHYNNVSFANLNSIYSLFMGTGDREHPSYSMIKNRIYAVYDDSGISTSRINTSQAVTDSSGASITFPAAVSSSPYTEDDLLNLTCDELDDSTTISSLPSHSTTITDPVDKDNALKQFLQEDLYDDAVYTDSSDDKDYLEQGILHENDAKGWYIILPDQGDSSFCSHCTYEAGYTSGLHSGEKVLSKLSLFYGTLYFTTYQPDSANPCNPQGNGFVYALNYLDATSALNLNSNNDTVVDNNPKAQYDVTDRYRKYTDIYGIPSGFNIITRNGEAGAMASMGGKVVGPGEVGSGGTPPYKIPAPGSGLDLYYWLQGNSN